MANKKVKKQPYEAFYISGSIYNVAAEGETVDLNNSTVVAEDKDGTDVTSTLLESGTKALADDPNGGTDNMLTMRVQAGEEDYSPYKVSFRIQTTDGNKYEVDMDIEIEEL